MSRVLLETASGVCRTVWHVCDAQVDQGRLIDGDPVGHGCLEVATTTVALGDGAYAELCAGCRALLDAEPARVTLQPARDRVVSLAALGPVAHG